MVWPEVGRSDRSPHEIDAPRAPKAVFTKKFRQHLESLSLGGGARFQIPK